MTGIRFVLMLYFFMVVHKAACQTLSKALVTDEADCSVDLALLQVAFLGKWVHGVCHSPVCQILLQIVVRTVITSSPPAWTSSAGMLSTQADFPFFNDCGHPLCVWGQIRLMRSLVTSIFLYACESWTLTAELQRRIQAIEMRCYRKILLLIQRPCYQRGSPCQDPAGNWTT